MNHVVVFDQDRCVAGLIRQILEENRRCHVTVVHDRAELLSRLSSDEEMSVMLVDMEAMTAADITRFCVAARNRHPNLGLVLTFGEYQSFYDPGSGFAQLFKPFSNGMLREAVADMVDWQGNPAAIT